MATQVTFCRVGVFAFGGVIPALHTGHKEVSETITASGSNQQTTATMPDLGGVQGFVRVATDTAIYVSFGTNPNATTDTARLMVPANAVEYFAVAAGAKAAVATV